MATITIAVLNPKGGSGKSTLATNLACALRQEGKSVMLVDSDPQGTARDWSATAGEDAELPIVMGVDRKGALKRTVSQLNGSYDMIVIDGSARVEGMSAEAIRVADLVLIPVQPSNADLWGCYEIVDLIQARHEVTDGKPLAAFVVSRQIVGTTLASEVAEALAAYELPVLEHRTSQRVAYTQALNRGGSVLDGDDPKAAAEISAIANDVLSLLNHQ